MERVRVPLPPARVRWGVVGVVALTILAASVAPPSGVRPTAGPLGLLGLDKYAHFLAYAGLAAALTYALVDGSAERVALVAFLAAASFGIVVEFVQLPIPYRTFSLGDAAANAAGASAAAVGWRALFHRLLAFPIADPEP